MNTLWRLSTSIYKLAAHRKSKTISRISDLFYFSSTEEECDLIAIYFVKLFPPVFEK